MHFPFLHGRPPVLANYYFFFIFVIFGRGTTQHQKHINSPEDEGGHAVEALNRNTKVVALKLKVTASESSQCSSVQLGLVFLLLFCTTCV